MLLCPQKFKGMKTSGIKTCYSAKYLKYVVTKSSVIRIDKNVSYCFLLNICKIVQLYNDVIRRSLIHKSQLDLIQMLPDIITLNFTLLNNLDNL